VVVLCGRIQNLRSVSVFGLQTLPKGGWRNRPSLRRISVSKSPFGVGKPPLGNAGRRRACGLLHNGAVVRRRLAFENLPKRK
jgi:hypothetical protein